ncbi:MAG TPA: DUF2490 domain-containing protein [Blastocatellia bacterium]|nr:DUF2490 domain-containing protein [Blastocatellia bacterium]
MKLRHLQLLLSAVLLCVLKAGAQQPAPPRDDTQLWTETQFIVPLKERTDLIFIGSLRFGRNVHHVTDERAGVAIAHRLNSHLSVQSTYQYIAQQPFEGQKRFEHRLSTDLTLRFRLGGFTLTDRNRIEYQIRHSRANRWIYRNQLRLEHPVGPNEWKFKVFISDEVFYSSDADAWTRNRISVGAGREFSKRFGAEFFYFRQQDGFSRPGNLQVFGTSFKIRLRD